MRRQKEEEEEGDGRQDEKESESEKESVGGTELKWEAIGGTGRRMGGLRERRSIPSALNYHSSTVCVLSVL